MKIEKFKVCEDCQSLDIIDPNCRCTYDRNYPIIELEFEVCECCNAVKSYPVDSEFNIQQWESKNKEI